jgi:hypothetical protein
MSCCNGETHGLTQSICAIIDDATYIGLVVLPDMAGMLSSEEYCHLRERSCTLAFVLNHTPSLNSQTEVGPGRRVI